MIRGEDRNECDCVFRVPDFITITHFGKILSAVENYKNHILMTVPITHYDIIIFERSD